MAMMQIGSALLGVRNGAGLVARQSEVGGKNPQLTDDGHGRREHAKTPHQTTTSRRGSYHLDEKYPAATKTVAGT